jgi:hypothetical protein
MDKPQESWHLIQRILQYCLDLLGCI